MFDKGGGWVYYYICVGRKILMKSGAIKMPKNLYVKKNGTKSEAYYIRISKETHLKLKKEAHKRSLKENREISMKEIIEQLINENIGSAKQVMLG